MRTTPRTPRTGRVFLLAGALIGVTVWLSSCGSGSEPTGPTAASHSQKPLLAALRPAKSGEENLADMVAAVSATRSGPAVQMKFTLSRRPEVGQQVEVDVVLLVDSPAIESVSGAFQGSEGLEVVDGAEAARVDKPTPGAPIHHTVRVLPRHDGIYALSAVVSVTSSGQAATRAFSIPVIAGEGLPERAAKAEPAKGL